MPDHIYMDLDINWGAEFEMQLVASTGRIKLPVKISHLRIVGTLRLMFAPLTDEAPFFKAVRAQYCDLMVEGIC